MTQHYPIIPDDVLTRHWERLFLFIESSIPSYKPLVYRCRENEVLGKLIPGTSHWNLYFSHYYEHDSREAWLDLQSLPGAHPSVSPFNWRRAKDIDLDTKVIYNVTYNFKRTKKQEIIGTGDADFTVNLLEQIIRSDFM